MTSNPDIYIRKYGVTEQKKAELDELVIEVRNAEDEVAQLQAVVDSLTQKLNKLNNELTIDEANKAQALSDKNLMNGIVLSTQGLFKDSGIVLKRMRESEKDILKTARQMSTLIDELIYSADLVNKLSDLITRKKETNPLISDELITQVTQAGTDANNAVALTLTALESVFVSQATNIEGQNVLQLENKFADQLYELTKYKQKDKDGFNQFDMFEVTQGPEDFMNISDMLLKAYNDYAAIYDSTLIATEDTGKQLSEATLALENEVVNLSSLKASLAAATAAALAS